MLLNGCFRERDWVEAAEVPGPHFPRLPASVICISEGEKFFVVRPFRKLRFITCSC